LKVDVRRIARLILEVGSISVGMFVQAVPGSWDGDTGVRVGGIVRFIPVKQSDWRYNGCSNWVDCEGAVLTGWVG